MYSGLGDVARWVLPEALQEQGRHRADQVWIEEVGGEELTFGAAAADALRVGGYFSNLGVGRGERIAVMMHNSCDFVRVWQGLSVIGAIAVLLNTELRGAFLLHQLTNSSVETAIVDAALVGNVQEVLASAPHLRRLIVVGGEVDASGVQVVAWEQWRQASPYLGPPPRGEDIACIMYTSGTSGPAKGVLMPHRHCALYGVGAVTAFELQPHDAYYIVLPLFHANGLLMQLGATLLAGMRAVLRPRFSASAWLEDIRRHDVTVTNLLGALAAFVVSQPETPRDRDHKLRALLNGPNLPEHETVFRERFGVKDVLSGYGMTEVNIPVWGRLGAPHPGAAGWVDTRHFDLMIADPETDAPVGAGEIGEILVRPKVPFGFMVGYLDMPERTVEAWRNLWFHSGDAGKMDATGLVTFIDRIKDCIRRRGENIAASEVEAVIAALEGVEEVAAFAAPSDIPGGEDEVMLAIVAAPGATLTIEAIGAHADSALPRFARPRFIAFVESLPKTATGKVQRAVLRKQGVAHAFDRFAPSKDKTS